MSGVNREKLKYDRSVFRVIVLAGILLVVATSIAGMLSYRIAESEVIDKLKENDLVRTAKSISNQVEARITRAIESSEMLAVDPAVLEWVEGGEKDGRLGEIVLSRLMTLPRSYDYTSSFVVSTVTSQYWAENGKVLERVSKDDPDDQWFFDTIAAGKPTQVVVDSNASRKNTFVFVNVLIGDPANPLGVAGVGMSLEALSEEFVNYKYGPDSHLWMVGADGTIHLSDTFSQVGSKLSDHLPIETFTRLQQVQPGEQLILEAEDTDGDQIDMISYPIRSADMRLVALIPRSETVGFLDTIKLNTALAVLISVVLVVFFFVYISRKLADPYKQALLINEELERNVQARTKELAERNKEIMDSIAYAQRIQQSVLPQAEALSRSFADHFSIWRPRDIVGGDFYWTKQVGDVKWIAVGDCTGHGVPGALMTMLSVSLLDRIAAQGNNASPAIVLSKLNVLLKETLNQMDREGEGLSDDGLDLGLMFLSQDGCVYAGTGITLAVSDGEGIRYVKGDKRKIGYRRTPVDAAYTDHRFDADPGRIYYLITDGIVDQNAPGSTASIGRTRLLEWLSSYHGLALAVQGERFERELSAYMSGASQRDDMTVLAFSPKYEA